MNIKKISGYIGIIVILIVGYNLMVNTQPLQLSWIHGRGATVFTRLAYPGIVLPANFTLPATTTQIPANVTNATYLSSFIGSVATNKLSRFLQFEQQYTGSIDFGINSYFDFFNTSIANQTEITKKSYTNLVLTGPYATQLGVAPTTYVNVVVNGNLTINSNGGCNVKGTFIVSGTITVQQPTLSAGTTSGCTYVSAGNISFITPAAASVTNNYAISDGAFFSDGNILVERDLATTRNAGLWVKGSLAAIGNITNKRPATATGPGLLVTYNPKYKLFFQNTFEYKGYAIREIK